MDRTGLSGRLWLASALAVAGCRGCDEGAALAVAGETPYVRCLAGSAADEVSVRSGGLRLKRKGRVLLLEGARAPLRIGAFSGPAFAQPPGTAELAELRAAQPDLLLLLGGLGDTPELARSTARSLAGLKRPTLILAGGRDTREGIADAIDHAGDPWLLDVTPVREIRIGGDTFVPVAGAFEGRYALADRACGYAAADLDQIESELDPGRSSRRWLLAWEAPPGLGRGATGAQLGSGAQALAAFGARIGAAGGLFAWPHVRVMQPSTPGGQRALAAGESAPDLRLVVPRLAGPPVEQADGARIPAGFALLELDKAGLRLLPKPAVP